MEIWDKGLYEKAIDEATIDFAALAEEVMGDQMKTIYHKPVMLEEAIQGLKIDPDGVYVDVTFGGGGHSRAILQKLSNRGRLLAFDRDKAAHENSISDDRFHLIDGNFHISKDI